MDRKLICIVVIMASIAALLAGCYPERIIWAPDGQAAAVFNEHGELYFIDEEGNISEAMDEGVIRLQWFPDGQRLAIAKDIAVGNWDDAEARIPSALLDELIRYTNFMLEAKNQEQWEAKEKALMESQKISSNEINGIKMYIRDRAGDQFSRSLIDSWQDELTFNCYSIQVVLWDKNQYTIEKILFSSGQVIWNLRTSNKGRSVAFTTAYPDDDAPGDQISLWIADTQTEKVVKLDENISLYPDWDTDGTSLFYVRLLSVSESDDTVGTILSCRVCDDQGILLDEFEQPKSLAGLVADKYTRIRCLADGRIVFPSIEITLPAIGKDVPDQKQLFVMDTRRQLTMARLIPRSAMSEIDGYNLDFFEVSPDELYISIPDDEGRVGVLSLATGDFKVVQNKKLDQLATVPVWRYPDQLCYIDEIQSDSSEDETTKQIILLRQAEDGNWTQSQVISQTWHEQARSGWLE